ncbi:uncharacterized protein PHALS_14819 [Plasmopara halstedii]|uniref:Uncharacterized protein n=1 Tax=Plasmopara halstedii TaxID=4781 RepID=A0A0N7L6Y3_PLAHL|nr:uncharacterized protein PHALS_14819 [Plasmopara halstedii]CEG45555.1 hypothetical protein PHALS_14819 [Plasmopara halstedii]|eukprot:XP_024581924.1 hypothetical protein PHALS_14819 [Plasmopara halstedii]
MACRAHLESPIQSRRSVLARMTVQFSIGDSFSPIGSTKSTEHHKTGAYNCRLNVFGNDLHSNFFDPSK